jgi:hypothetical protein
MFRLWLTPARALEQRTSDKESDKAASNLLIARDFGAIVILQFEVDLLGGNRNDR